jgi:hypothetical protein
MNGLEKNPCESIEWVAIYLYIDIPYGLTEQPRVEKKLEFNLTK